MGVHIPEARDQVLACRIDDPPCFGFPGVSYARDAIPIDDDRGPRLGFAVCNINDRRIDDGDGLRSRARDQENQSGQQVMGDSHTAMVLLQPRRPVDRPRAQYRIPVPRRHSQNSNCWGANRYLADTAPARY